MEYITRFAENKNILKVQKSIFLIKPIRIDCGQNSSYERQKKLNKCI